MTPLPFSPGVNTIHDNIEPWPLINRSGLESAVHQPRVSFQGCEAYQTLAAKSAVLMRGLACNHPFVDANKRTAFDTAQIFLHINGNPMADEDDQIAADFVTNAVAHHYSVEYITQWIAQRLI